MKCIIDIKNPWKRRAVAVSLFPALALFAGIEILKVALRIGLEVIKTFKDTWEGE